MLSRPHPQPSGLCEPRITYPRQSGRFPRIGLATAQRIVAWSGALTAMRCDQIDTAARDKTLLVPLA